MPPEQRLYQQKSFRNRPLNKEDIFNNSTKSKIRAKVEYPFLVLKRTFGFNKVLYRGLNKNANRLFVGCGLVNLYMVRQQYHDIGSLDKFIRQPAFHCIFNELPAVPHRTATSHLQGLTDPHHVCRNRGLAVSLISVDHPLSCLPRPGPTP